MQKSATGTPRGANVNTQQDLLLKGGEMPEIKAVMEDSLSLQGKNLMGAE